MNLKTLTENIILAIENKDYERLKSLTDEAIKDMTLTALMKLRDCVESEGVYYSPDINSFANKEDAELGIILMCNNTEMSFHDTKKTLSKFIDDHTNVYEFAEFKCFKDICDKITYVFNTVIEDETTYYLVHSASHINDIELTVCHITTAKIGCNTDEIEACIAQQVNRGRFDKDTFSRPCFDVDGWLSWPEKIVEITESTHKQLAQLGITQDFYTSIEHDSSYPNEVVKYLDATS